MASARKSATRVPRAQRPIPAAIAKGYKRYLKIAPLPGTAASGKPCDRVFDTPAVKVGGKLLSRWRTEAEGALAIRCDFLDRQILLLMQPEVFFVTDHYRNHPMILLRLDKAPPDVLRDVTERGWRFVAPRKLVKERQGR
jgi:hypothetical protein